jgi:hypothetical protein
MSSIAQKRDAKADFLGVGGVGRETERLRVRSASVLTATVLSVDKDSCLRILGSYPSAGGSHL